MKKEKTKGSEELCREMSYCQFPVCASKFNCNACSMEKKPEQLSTEKSSKEQKKIEETEVAFDIGPDRYLFFLKSLFRGV